MRAIYTFLACADQTTLQIHAVCRCRAVAEVRAVVCQPVTATLLQDMVSIDRWATRLQAGELVDTWGLNLNLLSPPSPAFKVRRRSCPAVPLFAVSVEGMQTTLSMCAASGCKGHQQRGCLVVLTASARLACRQHHYEEFAEALKARLSAEDLACVYIYPAEHLHITGAWGFPLPRCEEQPRTEGDGRLKCLL